MSDSTSNIPQLNPSSANLPQRINELFDAASPAMLYGRNAVTSTGLTWGYLGGRYASAPIANGTLTLAASQAAIYLVADRATGAVSQATSTTNWDDTDNFARLYKLTTGTSTVTGYEDHRQASGGSGGGGGAVASVVAGSGINVDSTDPANPVVSLSGAAGGFPTVTTDASTAHTAVPGDAGEYRRWTNSAAKVHSFDTAEAYAVNDEFNGRNVGAGNLTLAGVGGFLLNAPAGGTLVIPQGGTFTVKIVATGAADVFGVTVPL